MVHNYQDHFKNSCEYQSLHCRGYEFRPEYTKVCSLVSVFRNIPTLLLTATATTAILKDVCHHLALGPEEIKIVAIVPDR